MRTCKTLFGVLALVALAAVPVPVAAVPHFQCPFPLATDGFGEVLRDPVTGYPTGETTNGDVYCRHLAAGDGFAAMGDGNVLYTFGFSDVTGVPDDMVMDTAMLGANYVAPTLVFPEGKKIYLTITNVGMMMRPDLFDPHSLHFHGFPNAAPIFDGEPMSSISVIMGASLTYYYEPLGPGTYMYHCHVEATEHIQMGMVGNLYVTPTQDDGPAIGGFSKFAYNDGDGSTGYDIDYPIQLGGFDRDFHEKHIAIQALPFALMRDTYPMINGRGYPDTVVDGPLPALADEFGGKVSQPLPALISAEVGQRILLRISSLATVDFYTVGLSAGLTMEIVGRDAKLLRNGANSLFYKTNSITVGGGESTDAIIDTSGVPEGTYVLYVKNLNHLSNDAEDFGGMMTEIRITTP